MSDPVAPAPRRAVSTLVIAAGILAVAVAAVVSVIVLQPEEPRVTGLAPAAASPFDEDGEIAAGPSKAWFSPDGTRLAVRTAGALGLARDGTVELLTRRGGNVVDAAWFAAGTALLVAEGPTPTGGLVVVETDGTVRGSIPLEPSVAFGEGLGMTIAPGGKRAVVTAVERDPLGSRRHRLVAVDLTTGATTPIDTGAGDAMRPHHLDAGSLAFTRVRDETTEAVVLDLATGEQEVLGPGSVRGVIGAGELIAVQDEASLFGYPPSGGAPRTLASSPSGPVVAVHPSGATAVIALTRTDAVVLASIPLMAAGST